MSQAIEAIEVIEAAMTPEEFRRIALSFPGAVERSHMDHPDFRVNGKIFATLWKGDGVLILKKEQQEALVKSKPNVFMPVKGGWGRKGSTTVLLPTADQKSVRDALSLAWGNKASKARKPSPKRKRPSPS